MGYAETLKTISRRDFFRFAIVSTGMLALAAVGKYLQDQNPASRIKDCLQTQFSQAGFAIAEKTRAMRNTEIAANLFDPVSIEKIRSSISDLRGDQSDDEENSRVRKNFAITKAVMAQEDIESLNQLSRAERIKVVTLINYASEILKATGFTRREVANLSDQQAAYVLLETVKRAEDIHLRCF